MVSFLYIFNLGRIYFATLQSRFHLGNKLLAVVNALFAVLAILGVVTDPTTDGVFDSTQALEYTEPKKDNIE